MTTHQMDAIDRIEILLSKHGERLGRIEERLHHTATREDVINCVSSHVEKSHDKKSNGNGSVNVSVLLRIIAALSVAAATVIGALAWVNM